MGRGRNSRRRRRRERAQASPELLRSSEPPDRARVLRRFLVGRDLTTFGFIPYGPVFQSKSPEELAERFAEWVKRQAQGQLPS